MNPGNPLWYVGSFIVAIGILVVVHELGHYLAARVCGVKVLRFAVGFGKVVWSRRFGRDGTEWALAVFPLGGYVKMLDEREGEVAGEEAARAFNRQTVGRRAFIVAAGPVANLALAVLLYWVVFLSGVTELKPRLSQPPEGSPAAVAGVVEGMLVESVNGRPVASWQDLRWEILRHALDQRTIELSVKTSEGAHAGIVIEHRNLDLDELDKDPLLPLGLGLYRPRLPPVVGQVASGSAAEVAGFLPGDRIVSMDGQAISEWAQVAATARGSAGRMLDVAVARGSQRILLQVTPSVVEEGGQRFGRLGMMVQDDGQGVMTVEVRYGVLESAERAIWQTWDTSVLSLRMMGRMLTGDLSWKNLSGPVTIADYAGQSARMGLDHFLRFLALISISLGILNLLPVPVLDGGHLMYYLVEFIKGGPVSERVLEIGQQIGLALLAMLMAFAFYNDINRLFFG